MTTQSAHLLAVTLVFVLGACSSTKSAIDPTLQLKDDLHDAAQRVPTSVSKLRALSQRAIAAQEWESAAQALILLCQNETSPQRKTNACENLHIIDPLLEDGEIRFDAALTYYVQVPSDSALFRLKSLANTDIRKARAALAQNQLPVEQASILNQLDGADLAQFYYLQGKRSQDQQLLHQAAALFERVNQPQKAADSLFLLARIQYQNGSIELAHESAAKSYFLLVTINNQSAQETVRRWINDLPTAR